MANIHLIGQTFELVGTLLLAIILLMVHQKVRVEGKIDKRVVKLFEMEHFLGILAILLIISGFFMQVLN
jgi:hypothetical protein